jgi:hypothetical protein
VTSAGLVEQALVKIGFDGVPYSLVEATASAKKPKLYAVGTAHEKKTAERGTPDDSVITEGPVRRTGSHICRPVKKSWHATFHTRTNGGSVPPAVHKAIDSVLVLTIADPQK